MLLNSEWRAESWSVASSCKSLLRKKKCIFGDKEAVGYIFLLNCTAGWKETLISVTCPHVFFFTKTHTGTLSETLFFKCSGAADSITHKMLCDTCVCGCVCVSRGLFNKAGSTLYVYPNPTHPAQKISGVQKCSAQPCRSGDRSISTCLSPHLSAATGTVVSLLYVFLLPLLYLSHKSITLIHK